MLQEKKYQKGKGRKEDKGLLYASIIVRTLGHKKFVIELTESGADYCRASASIAKLGQSGRSFAFNYLFIYLSIYSFIYFGY